jgi:GTPase Era involved in 16S rRNA processing
MLKPKIYIDTSVIGGCFDKEFSEASNKLFEEFKSGKKIAIISDIKLLELKKAPENIKNKLNEIPEDYIKNIILDDEAEQLADKYILEKVISVNCTEDARHIALATINNVDILASWNFKHIVNVARIHGFNAVNLKEGYHILEIRSPLDILEVTDGE